MNLAGLLSPEKTMFLVWAPPDQGSSRSRMLAKELGINELHYIFALSRTRSWSAPLRYLIQGWKTLALLARKKPSLVFVQSPPSFGPLVVRWYCRLTGAQYIIDAHSDALQRGIWQKPLWLHSPVIRDAVLTLVHDEHFTQKVTGLGGTPLVLRDPITSYEWQPLPLADGINITVVNRFAEDEPVGEVLKAAAQLPEVTFHITGNPHKAPAGLIDQAPANVRFTGYLPYPQYYGLLKNSQAVICLTTRDNTFQCGANEALSLETPVITSNWKTLRSYLYQGAVFVDNTGSGIAQGVREMTAQQDKYRREIRELRRRQRETWEDQIRQLLYQVGAKRQMSGSSVKLSEKQ